LQAEQYQQLQEAARAELSARRLGAEGDSPIDPFAVLTREQIEKLLADFKTKDDKSKGA
jgi:hypothetical protein